MIQEIFIKNTGSFRDGGTLSLCATEYGGKLDNVSVRAGLPPVLRLGMIYGANASGKTQFIRALFDLREQLRGNRSWQGPSGLRDFYRPFKFDKESTDTPSEIRVTFDVSNISYRYSVKYNGQEYLTENLEVKGHDDWEPILSRTSGRSHEVTLYRDTQASFGRTLQVPGNVLALSQFLTVKDEIGAVAQYLANLQVCNGYNDNMRRRLWKEVQRWLNPSRKATLTRFLNAVDVSVDELRLPQQGDAEFEKIVFRHRMWERQEPTEKTAELSILDESQGTKWLLLLGAKIIEALESGYALFIDELDACYHPQVTKALLSLFRDETINTKHAQLILTTHNVYLMDEKFMRRDQIWFAEKKKDGVSELYNLVEFEDTTENTPFTNWYLANRFGGTPNLHALKNVFA